MVAIKNCYNDDDDGNGNGHGVSDTESDGGWTAFTNTKKSFGQIEGSIESRSVRSCRNQSRVLREASAVPSISTLSSTYHGWSHFARLVILGWCSNMETRLEFSAQQVQAIMKDHFGYNDYSSNQWSITEM
jgi:hypothetical protein